MNSKLRTLLSITALSFGAATASCAYAKETIDTSKLTNGDSNYEHVDYSKKYDQAETKQSSNQDTKTFAKADQDKNGYITQSEFKKAHLNAKFNDVDSNSDGQVSEREMRDAISMY